MKQETVLSVVYAVHNEEKNLASSLESIKDIADEIIIVDGDSTDDTVKIAKRYGARVISTSNKPIFHINKQMAMDEAKGTWTLQMDADEVVDDEMRSHIVSLLRQDPKEAAAGYWLRRKNYFLGTYLTKGGQYPDPVIRFYQTGKGRLPMKSVHEQIEIEGEVEWLRGHLLHNNSPSFSDYLRKANTYTSLTASEWKKAGESIGLFSAVSKMFLAPLSTFLKLYLRHKGFLDGFPGFAFSLFSGLHFLIAYIKLWELHVLEKHERSV